MLLGEIMGNEWIDEWTNYQKREVAIQRSIVAAKIGSVYYTDRAKLSDDSDDVEVKLLK